MRDTGAWGLRYSSYEAIASSRHTITYRYRDEWYSRINAGLGTITSLVTSIFMCQGGESEPRSSFLYGLVRSVGVDAELPNVVDLESSSPIVIPFPKHLPTFRVCRLVPCVTSCQTL